MEEYKLAGECYIDKILDLGGEINYYRDDGRVFGVGEFFTRQKKKKEDKKFLESVLFGSLENDRLQIISIPSNSKGENFLPSFMTLDYNNSNKFFEGKYYAAPFIQASNEINSSLNRDGSVNRDVLESLSTYSREYIDEYFNNIELNPMDTGKYIYLSFTQK